MDDEIREISPDEFEVFFAAVAGDNDNDNYREFVRGYALVSILALIDAGVEYVALEAAVKYPQLNDPGHQLSIRTEVLQGVVESLGMIGVTEEEISRVLRRIREDGMIPYRQDHERIARDFPLTVTPEVIAAFPQEPVITPAEDHEDGNPEA